MLKTKKINYMSILQIIFLIVIVLQSQILGQGKKYCLTSTIKFENSSIEKIIMHPEDILEEPNKFWESDPAYQLVKLWHKRVSFPVEMEKWRELIQNFQKQSVEEREKNNQLIASRKMLWQEKDFNEKATRYLCSFLPQNCPDISTTIYFTTAIMASGFQIDNKIVIYGANADKDNLLIHELFHQGFNKCIHLESNGAEDSTINQIYYEFQNEGMATYVGYKALKEFPKCRTDLLKDDYKLFENYQDIVALLNIMNGILQKSSKMGEKELKEALWQAGSTDRGYYVVGCFMAKTIDDQLGREELVSTILKGPKSFLLLYNSLVDEKLRVYSFYK